MKIRRAVLTVAGICLALALVLCAALPFLPWGQGPEEEHSFTTLTVAEIKGASFLAESFNPGTRETAAYMLSKTASYHLYDADGEHLSWDVLQAGDSIEVEHSGVVLYTSPETFQRVYRVLLTG